jgi:hypothetical protein
MSKQTGSIIMMDNGEVRRQVGVGEFVDSAIVLPNAEFEQAMRLDNSDKNIDNIKMAAWTEDAIEAYERN